MSEQAASGVRAHVVDVAEDFVRYWARLYADVLLLDPLHQVRIHRQAEPMADALGSEQNSVKELRVFPIVGLSSVQVQLEAITKLHFHSHDLVEEVVDERVVVFFVDHVEARDQVGLGVGLDDVVKLRLDVVPSEHLEAANDKFHSKQGEAELDLFDAVLKDGQLFSEWNFCTIVVKEAAKDVAVFDHSHALDHEITGDSVQDSLEEALIVVELEGELELELETLPDCMVLTCACRRFQSHLVL